MKIMGHRGARNEAPENTLAGFLYLRQLGVHCVELDLQLSKDGQLMVIHDPTLSRTTLKQGKVSEYTAAELEQMDARCTHPQWPTFAGIPTLEKVLSVWPELETIQLEVKKRPMAEYPQLIDRLAKLIDAFDLKNKATITSSDCQFLQYSASQLLKQPHGYIAEADKADALNQCLALNCQALIAHYSLCKKELIAQAHTHQIIVSAWTVNNIEEMKRLKKAGIDFLITDIPTQAFQIEEKRHSQLL